MGGEDKQQHYKGADVSGDCRSYGGSVEPICNVDLERLHVLDDLTELEKRKAEARKPRLSLSQYLLYIWPLFPASRT